MKVYYFLFVSMIPSSVATVSMVSGMRVMSTAAHICIQSTSFAYILDIPFTMAESVFERKKHAEIQRFGGLGRYACTTCVALIWPRKSVKRLLMALFCRSIAERPDRIVQSARTST